MEVLDKFTIEDAKTSIDGISKEFTKHIGYIPPKNRDGYIASLLGQIMAKVKEPPHSWEVTKTAFDPADRVSIVCSKWNGSSSR